MANNCVNYVSFRGSASDIKKFKKELNQAVEHSINFDEYVWGDISNGRGVYFGSIPDPKENSFYCVSAWSPEPEIFAHFTRKYNLGFSCIFECGSNVVGGFTAIGGFINRYDLTQEEIDNITKSSGGIDYEVFIEEVTALLQSKEVDVF